MVSTATNITFEDIKTLLSLFDDETFYTLLVKTLQVLHFTSATGVAQTLEEIEPATYKRLNNLEKTFTDEFQEVGVDDYNSFIFLFYTFKDMWATLLYKTLKSYVRKIEEKSHE
ncbi:unnamed protein product [Rhizophagus irregularis]|nr:unnamed protein product [Rhizophagus irregularis]